MTAPASPTPLAAKLLTGIAVIALLYLGREVLAPVTLAGTLAFVLSPVVRRFRRLGLGQTGAALSALVLAGLLVAGIGMVIIAQLGAMSRELPGYEANVREKIATLRKLTVDQLHEAQGRAGRMIGDLAPASSPAGRADAPAPRAQEDDTAPTPAAPRGDAFAQLVAAVWGPVGAVGIVVLVLIFALLEQDALRDRLIRLLGGNDVRAATAAVNDAGQRLSRYFISQFSVNVGVAGVIWALLALLGVPHAVVWAVLAGLLRFVPYVGFPAAALCACAMAAAMVPGWELAGSTALVFLGVELIVAHVIEPQLYGHATGLSPFSVVVAAIFWSALWGPVGLLLSTPLTLCLVVAGRHSPTLAFLDVLLGDAPALSLAQRFYQRSLSGDAVEILSDARAFLKRRTLAAYCDKVVLPAFALARHDVERDLITQQQRQTAQGVILQVFAELAHLPRPRGLKRLRGAVLDGDLGLNLRQERVAAEGRWQGALDVPPGSLQLVISMDDREAHLTAELLVRVLRDAHFDARHITVQELAEPPAEGRAESVGTVFVVGATSDHVDPADARLLDDVLTELPQAHLVALMPTSRNAVDQIAPERKHHTAYSFDEVLTLLRQD